MAGVNKVILIGHLGADPEIRRTQAGDPVANMRIATSESWRDKETGERREKTEWHTVVVFNETAAKFAEQYLRKGARVYVEGQLQTRKWQDQSGQDRYTTEVVLQKFRGDLQSLDKAPSNRPPAADDPDAYGKTTTRESRQQSYADASGGTVAHMSNDLNDEIPF